MTGKFHTHWGEVGGYKKPEALLYECGAMLAHGARCSIGDHLHPTGSIDASTMGIIAPAYKWVAEREAWAEGTTNRAEIALLSLEAATGPTLVGVPGHHVGADEGAVRVLLEGKFTFDVVDLESDLSPYRLRHPPRRHPRRPRAQGQARSLRRRRRPGAADGHGAASARTAASSSTSAPSGRAPRPTRAATSSCRSQALRADFVADPLFMYAPAERITLTDGEIAGRGLRALLRPHARGTSPATSTPPASPTPPAWACGVAQGRDHLLRLPDLHLLPPARRGRDARDRREADRLGARRPADGDRLAAARRTRHRPPPGGQNRDVVHLLHAAPVLRGQFRGAPCSRSRT